MTQAARPRDPVRRRLLAACALAPFAVGAAVDPKARRLVLFDHSGSVEETRERWAPTLAALAKRGWREGERLELLIRVSGRYAPGSADRYQRAFRVADELVALRPDCILTAGTAATRAVTRVTKEIPIVTHTADPVASGFVKSLARPGGNVTGLSGGYIDLAAKNTELLKALIPGLRKVAILHFPEGSFAELADFIESGAKAAGVAALRVPMAMPADRILEAVPGLRARGVQAAIYASGTMQEHYSDVARLAIRERLPMWCMADEEMVEAGLLGLLQSLTEESDPLAEIVDEVLRGARPADIPVRLPQRFRLAFNRATANALGLKVPPDILVRADRVIE